MVKIAKPSRLVKCNTHFTSYLLRQHVVWSNIKLNEMFCAKSVTRNLIGLPDVMILIETYLNAKM